MMEIKKICTFDEWLFNRTGMTEQVFLNRLGEGMEVLRLEHCRYDLPSPESVLAVYRRKHREETDITASENIDYTFMEWLEVYEHHTPETFHDMCAGTGVSPGQEKCWMEFLRKKWEKRHEALITGNNPFKNKED